MPDQLGVPGRGRHVAAAGLQAGRVRHLPGRVLGGAGGQVTPGTARAAAPLTADMPQLLGPAAEPPVPVRAGPRHLPPLPRLLRPHQAVQGHRAQAAVD